MARPMTRLRAAFAGRKAFIPFVVAGDPDLETTVALVRALGEAGADAIEVGVPFSDPVADGPTIQRVAERALARGTTLARTLAALEPLRAVGVPPLVLFTYLNPLLAFMARDPAGGGAALARACDAALVVDLPLEEAEGAHRDLIPRGVERIYLAAPSTHERRLARLAAAGGPFVYYVSRYGVTGARADIPEDLAASVRRVREAVGRPVAVGFGVSTPDQAVAVARIADGVVVGSAIVERVEQGMEAARAFAREIADAVHGSG